jgi:virginiamycin B lyase
MWFAEYNTGNIGRITPTGQITEFAAGGNPTDLALGSDGNVWFTSYNTNQVGKISTSGVATLYNAPAGAGPAGIAAGPDGNLWVTEYNSGAIAQITTAGVFTQFTIPTANSQPWAINAGAGGTLWFAESGTNQIGRVTTNGQFEEYAIPTAGSDPRGVDTAADGGVWFTEYGGNQIGKLTPEAPPSISLSVAYGTGKTVTLSGQVTDSAPGGLTVTFSGQVTGSVVTNADGSFSGTFTASGLGAVQATTTDGEGLVSNPATVTLSSTPPVISNFTGGTNIAQIWTFTGTVTAPNAPGLVVTFSGIPAVTGKTATVQANGTFELSVFIPAGQDGTVAVQTTDAWGQLSNESLWIVSM